MSAPAAVRSPSNTDPDILAIRPSPFHDRAAEHCRTNAWTRRGRFTLVDVYSEIYEEYWAAKADAGLADLSFLHSYRFKGSQAKDAVAHILATAMAPLDPGRFVEAFWCTDGGFVIGQGRLYCETPESFILVCPLPCESWFADSISGFDCALTDFSASSARLGLEGPAARIVFEAMGLNAAIKLEVGHFVVGMLRGLAIGVARLADDRYELWTAVSEARVLWDRLMRAGRPLGLKPLGAAAQTILRLERGEPEPGLDYANALTTTSWHAAARPAALGAEGRLDLSRTAFVGREALLAAPRPPRRLVRVLAETAEPIGAAVITHADNSPAGYLTSSGYSPALCGSLGLGWVEGPNFDGPYALLLAPDADSRGKLRRFACRLLP